MTTVNSTTNPTSTTVNNGNTTQLDLLEQQAAASSSSGVSSTSVQSSRQSPEVGDGDGPSQYFFDRTDRDQPNTDHNTKLIDSFSLFTDQRHSQSGQSENLNVGEDEQHEDFYSPHQIPQTIMFNRQQFQQQWNQRFYPNFAGTLHSTPSNDRIEIHELDQSELDNPDFLDHPGTADGHIFMHDDISQEPMPSEMMMQSDDQHYENYMVDYDVDYDQYYDQQQQNGSNGHAKQNGYVVQSAQIGEDGEADGEEVDLQYYTHPEGYSVGEPEVSMDLMSDAKTYGLMLPPYHHYKQQQQQMIHPQFQMLQHPYMYGNPFSYNLHTIIEESENETSSLQTLSSLNSSNFASLQFDPSLGNPVSGLAIASTTKQSVVCSGELSDASPDSSPASSANNSPQLRGKFTKTRSTKSKQKSNNFNNVNKRLSGGEFSEISFSSSSTFSEPSSERSNSEIGEEEEEEYESKPIVSQNVCPPLISADEGCNPNMIGEMDNGEIMSTTSKLERYFTSSLLDTAQRQRKGTPKVTSPTPRTTQLVVIQPIQTNSTLVNSTFGNSEVLKSSSIVLNQKRKSVLLCKLVTSLLVDPELNPLPLEQLNLLNLEYFRIDWIRILEAILKKDSLTEHYSQTVCRLFRQKWSADELSKHVQTNLMKFYHSVIIPHLVYNHRLAGKLLLMAKLERTNKQRSKTYDIRKSRQEIVKSQIEIRINQGQRMIIIKNDSIVPPKVPQRTKRVPQMPKDVSKTLYRTVLQINDINDPASLNNNQYETQQNARLSQLLNQSNPLNRNFLASTMLTENQESQETAKRSKPELEQPKSKLNKSKNLLNTSTQLLLGSLRSKSKERNKYPNERSQSKLGNSEKFKTISNIRTNGYSSSGAHTRLTTTKSNVPESELNGVGGSKKLDRSNKGSKSFRDQRPNTSNQSTTWDSIYGSGIKLLKNISFVRSRNRASTPKDHPGTSNSRDSLNSTVSHESESSSVGRSKSLSEPNLHKRGRVRASKSSTSKDESQAAKSTPQLTTSNQTTSDQSVSSRRASTEEMANHGTVVSTPSLLYRLSHTSSSLNSNLGASAPGVSAMRSISTSSLRTRRHRTESGGGTDRGTGGGVHYLETPNNGEWQSIHSEVNRSASPSWSKSTPTIQHRSTASIQIPSVPPSKSPVLYRATPSSSHIPSKESNNCVELLSSPTSTSSNIVAGEIALSVNYDMRIGSLEISIHKCRIELVGKQKADLYAKVYLLPDRVKANKRKTRVVKAFKATTARSPNQLHAEFNETLRFIGPFGEFTGRRLWMSVWHSDKFARNALVAESVLGPLDLSMLSSGALAELRWYRLMEPLTTQTTPVTSNNVQRAASPVPLAVSPTKRPSDAIVSIGSPTPHQRWNTSSFHTTDGEQTDDSSLVGTIFVAIKYQSEESQSTHYHPHGSLHIMVKEARNLQFPISVVNTIGSTFCKLTLQPERSKQDRQKSSAIKSPLEYSSNPRWNQSFEFRNLSTSELGQRELELSVWFQVELGMQKSGKKLFVGAVRLSSSNPDSTTEEVNLWNQLLDRPNMWAYSDIPLRQLKLYSK